MAESKGEVVPKWLLELCVFCSGVWAGSLKLSFLLRSCLDLIVLYTVIILLEIRFGFTKERKYRWPVVAVIALGIFLLDVDNLFPKKNDSLPFIIPSETQDAPNITRFKIGLCGADGEENTIRSCECRLPEEYGQTVIVACRTEGEFTIKTGETRVLWAWKYELNSFKKNLKTDVIHLRCSYASSNDGGQGNGSDLWLISNGGKWAYRAEAGNVHGRRWSGASGQKDKCQKWPWTLTGL